MKKVPSLFLTLLLTVPAGPLRAQNNPFNMPDELDQAILHSLDLLYDLKYDDAIAAIEKLQPHAEEHPIVAFSLASAHWWRLSVLVLEPDMEESAPFLKAVDRAMELAEIKIDEGDPTGEAHLVMGGTLGLWGRWEATNHNWLSAYFKGKKAIRYLRKTLEINPKMTDAYMGLGIFDYYVATLPAVVRVLAFLGSGADKQKGIDELRKAAYESNYAQIPSRLFLVDVYAHQENKPAKALEILDTMRDDHPNSPFVHFLTVMTYYNHQKDEKLLESADDFLRKLGDGTYIESTAPIATFCAGIAHFKQSDWEEAHSYFSLAIDTQKTESAFYTWSFLFRGYCNHKMGRKEQAEDDFKSVLNQLRRWSSHDNARKALQNPDKAVKEQLKRIQL